MLLTVAGALAASDALLQLGSVCSFRAQTGVGCLGCGGSHAFARMAHGDLAGALSLNLLGAWTGLAAWLLVVAASHGLATGRGRVLGLAVVFVTVLSPLAFVWTAVRWWMSLPAGFKFPH